VGNWIGLGSAWVSGQMIFSEYTANNYPRSTFDLVVFGGKFNTSWTPQAAKRMVSLQSFFCFLCFSRNTVAVLIESSFTKLSDILTVTYPYWCFVLQVLITSPKWANTYKLKMRDNLLTP